MLKIFMEFTPLRKGLGTHNPSSLEFPLTGETWFGIANKNNAYLLWIKISKAINLRRVLGSWLHPMFHSPLANNYYSKWNLLGTLGCQYDESKKDMHRLIC